MRLKIRQAVWGVAGAWSGLLISAPAAAALTCEQMFAITEAAVRYRDQGQSLNQVLAGLKGIDVEHKLEAAEVEVLRQAVSAAYMSTATPKEIALECVEARGEKR